MSQVPASNAPVPSNASQPPGSNGAAIGSLVCGLLLCIPGITAILAIVLGLVGLKKSKTPGIGGGGMAIAGIILGIVGLIGWAAGGIGAYKVYNWGSSLVDTAKATAVVDFTRDLADGKISSAMQYTTGNVDRQHLSRISADLKELGTFKDVKVNSFDHSTTNGVTTLKLGGTAIFAQGSRSFQITLQKQGSTFKISQFDLE